MAISRKGDNLFMAISRRGIERPPLLPDKISDVLI
jgi:hypothetical protein